MPYQVRTFGGWSLLGPDGEPIEAVHAHTKAAAVLAYLATRPVREPVDRADLLPLLWPERTEEQGRNSLRTLLTRLRGRLPEGALGGKGEDRLWLEESVLTSDVRRFERALQEDRPRDALGLYRGPFLEHVHLTDAATFNRWAEERRSVYQRDAYEAALAVGENSREAGELEKAERVYRRALEIAPLKEEAAAGLIRVLEARGQRADALQLYESFRDRLEEELDLSVSGELQELADRIRSEPPGTTVRASAEESLTGLAGADGDGEDGVSGWRERRGWLPVVLLAIGTAAAGLWLGSGREAGGPQGDTGAREGTRRPTVAVLPFEDLGEAEDARPIREGLHSELLTRLSHVDGLGVVSRTSVLPYRDAEVDLSALADSVGAEWVLEGGVQKRGDRIRVNAQLINPSTDVQVWAASYGREFTAQNLFQIQEELTQKIVRALDVELTPEDQRQLGSVPTENTAAYELYLQAQDINAEGTDTEARTERSIRLYRRAVELDSTFAGGWAGLADEYVDRAWERGWDRAWADSALQVAHRALKLNPELAMAHVQLGDAHWVLGNTERQLEAYRRAWELKPEPEVANNLIVWLEDQGEYAEKLKWLDRVFEATPSDPVNVRNLILTNVLLGRDSVADAWRRVARNREISLAQVEFVVSLLYRADVDRARSLLERLADDEEATEQKQRRAALALYEEQPKQALRLYRELYPPSVGGRGLSQGLLTDRLGLAWALQKLGQRTEAEHIAEEVRADARDAIEGDVPGTAPRNRLAVTHLLLGDTAVALKWLEAAVESGERNRFLLQSVPTLAPLRDHPRFQSLLDRVDELLAEQRRMTEENGWGEPPEEAVSGN